MASEYGTLSSSRVQTPAGGHLRPAPTRRAARRSTTDTTANKGGGPVERTGGERKVTAHAEPPEHTQQQPPRLRPRLVEPPPVQILVASRPSGCVNVIPAQSVLKLTLMEMNGDISVT
ncbi:hypothetical protein EYF80_032972 [Liparis tanakae]|uniref:Uncharacterized protein n=1 Tax=Liparis tanakae TaxID=230148 RepID=A0A4Z2GW44_9TELE|nr:hypothetical protein EYF80_032972 [Liparis tanakae]